MHTLRTVLLASSAAAISTAALAGPLSPPSGPVAPTMKTLVEVEPRIAINATNTPGDNDASPSVFKITQPGSYYLTGNITLADSRWAIEVASSDVTIDLSGFRLSGGGVSLSGISYNIPGLKSVSVRNGTITGFVSNGVALDFVNYVVLENLTVRACGGGARIGNDPRVRDCQFVENTGTGLVVNSGGVVENCVSAGNTGDGLASQGRTIFRGCAVRDNDGRGLSGLSNAVVTDCSAVSNGLEGFWLQGGCTITNSHAGGNGAAGIYLNGTCSAVGNTSLTNVDGIVAANAANKIDSNHVNFNTANGVHVMNANNVVVRNTARGNATNYNIPTSEYAQIITDPGNNFVATNPWANFAY